VDLSLVILTLNEEHNLKALLPQLRSELEKLHCSSEILVVDGGSTDRSREVSEQYGARVLVQQEPGYGAALRLGLNSAHGDYIAALDADGSHPPDLLAKLWERRFTADLIIGSRYLPGGSAGGPWIRRLLSRTLSVILPKMLSVPATDLSSGYRLYRRHALTPNQYESSGFEILLEILVRLYATGHKLAELPLVYEPRKAGVSHVKLFRFGMAYIKASLRMWKLRNSVDSADYDHRAYYSRIPLQMYWQRKRCSLVRGFLGEQSGEVLDIGCGTSRIIQQLPNAIAADRSFAKLRYLSRTNKKRVLLSTFELPFRSGAIDTIIHSQVIEHIPLDPRLYSELNRVLKPGGKLIIGTPDYGRIWWPITEFFYKLLLPNAYADEHITHYTNASLRAELVKAGFEVLEQAYICGGELIFRCRKL